MCRSFQNHAESCDNRWQASRGRMAMVDSLSVVGLIAIEAGGAVLTALAVVLAVRWLGAGWREARERHQARDVAALRAELFELRQAIDRLAAAQAASTADGSGGGATRSTHPRLALRLKHRRGAARAGRA